MEKNERGYIFSRVLQDGRAIDVMTLTYQRARILISANSTTPFVDDMW